MNLQQRTLAYIAERKVIEAENNTLRHKLAISEEALRFAIEDHIEDCPDNEHLLCKMGTNPPPPGACVKCCSCCGYNYADDIAGHKSHYLSAPYTTIAVTEEVCRDIKDYYDNLKSEYAELSQKAFDMNARNIAQVGKEGAK